MANNWRLPRELDHAEGLQPLIMPAAARPVNGSVAAVLESQPGRLAMDVEVRNIATFHLNGLGDLLFTLPALQALRDTFPASHICAVLRPALEPLLQGSPLVDEILPRPKGGISSQASLMARLRARRVDIAIGFSQSRKTTLLVWSTGAAIRLGFTSAKMETLLTHRVVKEGPPTIETHLDLVRAIGCQTRCHDYCDLLRVSPQHTRTVTQLLQQYGVTDPYVVVAPDASEKRGIKEWPADRWASTLSLLAQRWPIVLAGTKPCTAVTSLLQTPVNARVADLGGLTDLPTLAALLARARLFMGIDSGVLHLAAAMNTPAVCIFGPTDWNLTGPRGVPHRIVRHPVECSPCMLPQCKWAGADERKCLTRLEPEAVVKAARELIGV